MRSISFPRSVPHATTRASYKRTPRPCCCSVGARRPATWAILVQAIGTLVIILVASQFFVRQLESAATLLGLPAAVTALLLSPVATELPEIMNAIIWVRAGKSQLALANISGAMMIQATVPSGIGLLFTPWRLDAPLLVSGLMTMAAIGYLLVVLRRAPPLSSQPPCPSLASSTSPSPRCSSPRWRLPERLRERTKWRMRVTSG
ncbi:sodium:calcium antiporter [Fodinicola feengrottensis]|uniref:sodium:calcium antiporter n=1 Tax=Fodinicola feengrottensis TaxID=435914 RepID=UPI0036F1ECF6